MRQCCRKCQNHQTLRFVARIMMLYCFFVNTLTEQSCCYVWPEEKRATICTAIEDTICDSPLVLINTIHGCLCDKLKQASAFEKMPTFTEFISAMTIHIDHAYIEQEVGKYF